MERDLRVIRQKRAERDRANGLLPALSPPKAAGDASQKAEGASTEAASAAPTREPPGVSGIEDTQMTDQAADFRPQAPTAQMQELPPKTDDRNVIGTMSGMPQDPENSAGLAITIPPESTAKVEGQPDNIDKRPTNTTAAAPEVPLDTTDPVDFDFESMFNDTDLVNTDDTTNFNLDFSTDDVSQNIMNDSAFENIKMGDADMTNVATTSNEDINSLLPGLENYVNADTDISNLGISATSALPQPTQVVPAATTSALAPNAGEMAPVDPSLDHLFDGIDFDMPSTGGDDMGDSNLVDLDDFNWD